MTIAEQPSLFKNIYLAQYARIKCCIIEFDPKLIICRNCIAYDICNKYKKAKKNIDKYQRRLTPYEDRYY